MLHLVLRSQPGRDGAFRPAEDPRQAGEGRQEARGFWRPAGLHLLVLLLMWSGALPSASAQITPAAESGEFTILSGNRQIGVEKFKINPVASGLEATGELQLDVPGSPQLTESCSLKLDARMRPASYQRQQRSPKRGAITVQFGSPESKLTSKTEAGTEDRVFFLSDDHLVVLDTNFFHHYGLLLRQFDPSQPGPQQFNVFVPQEATPGTISLEFQGKETQLVGKTQRELNHFQAVTEEVKMEIWASPQGEIYRISIPQAKLEIVRR